jgi:hypothetical protein
MKKLPVIFVFLWLLFEKQDLILQKTMKKM